MPDTTPTLSVANLVLRSKQQEIDALRHLAHKAEWVDVIGQLVQRLQRERGASCIYLASQTQRFAEVRHQAVNEALLHEEKLRQVFSAQMDPTQGTSAQTLSLMAWALLGLESLPALRLQIDRQAMSALDAVAAYSHLIAGLVELVFHMADTAGVPSVSRLLVALLHAVQATEEAGQERAVGALLYASGHCQEAHQQRLLHLIDAQERSLRVFGDFAEPALRARWDELQLAPCMAQLERLRRALCVARPGTALDSDLSHTWFGACSERMDGLWQLQGALVQRLREECDARIAHAQQDLQDSRNLLRLLRENPPQRTHAVDRFFETGSTHPTPPEQADHPPTSAEPTPLRELLRTQSQRMAQMEAELEATRRTLNERKIIERAKGVLMARLGMTEDVAFRALQKTSMDQNRRLLEVAEATLALPDLAFATPASGARALQ